MTTFFGNKKYVKGYFFKWHWWIIYQHVEGHFDFIFFD